MKFTTETVMKTVEHQINGVTHHVTVPHKLRVPKLPKDIAALVRTAMWTATAVVVLAAIVWSTVAISSLLALAAPLWAAVMIASIFDLAWVVAMGAEWMARFQPDKAQGPRCAGMVALGISVALIIAHGWHAGSVLAGIAGALVSVVAKGMWHTVLGSTSVELSPEDQAWVHAELSRAGTTLALAAVRRQVAHAEQTAALELLAAERVRGEIDTVRGDEPVPVVAADVPAEQITNTREHAAELEAEHVANIALNSANNVRDLRDRAVPSIAELARTQVASGADVDEAVTAILAAYPALNRSSVAATVRRERRRFENGTGGYM